MGIIAVGLAGSILMLFVLMPLYIYMKRKRFRNQPIRAHQMKHSSRALLIKGSATCVAVVYCLVGLLKAGGFLGESFYPPEFAISWLVLAGMVICLLGDVLLGVNFILGMLIFLAGHLCYIVYFIQLGGFHWQSLLLFVCLVAGMLLFFARYRKSFGKTAYCYYLYGAIVLMTFSIGVFLPLGIGAFGLLPAIAAAMLMIGDYMLAYMVVTKVTPIADAVSLGFYYGGQYIMAMSVFLPAFIKL